MYNWSVNKMYNANYKGLLQKTTERTWRSSRAKRIDEGLRALLAKTSSEAFGITIEGQNKWITLIKNAIKRR